MAYAGGKYFQAKRIAGYIQAHYPGLRIVEPFCGSLAVTAKLGNVAIASDICEPLIVMWQAVRDGWIPPDYVSREDYERYKAKRDPQDPMTAFAGFWHSFGGKWIGGYFKYGTGQEKHPMPKPGGASRRVRQVITKCKGTELRCCDYRDFQLAKGDLAYLDPPYEATTAPGMRGEFDSCAFWAWVREQERRGAVCLVSEAHAPDGFEAVLTLKAAKRLANNGNSGHRGEALYRLAIADSL